MIRNDKSEGQPQGKGMITESNVSDLSDLSRNSEWWDYFASHRDQKINMEDSQREIFRWFNDQSQTEKDKCKTWIKKWRREEKSEEFKAKRAKSLLKWVRAILDESFFFYPFTVELSSFLHREHSIDHTTCFSSFVQSSFPISPIFSLCSSHFNSRQ